MDISEVLTRIDNAGFEDTAQADKLDVINDTIWDIESREPWPFLEKTATLNFDGTNPNPSNLPADFKAVMWVHDDTNGVSIWPERLSTIRNNAGSQITLVEDPVSYYFIGNSFRFWPIPPASTGRYRLDYYASQPEVTSTTLEAAILMPPRHHRVIVVGSLWRLFDIEDDPENASTFLNRYETRIEQMREDLFRRQYQRADRIFVIDEDDLFEY